MLQSYIKISNKYKFYQLNMSFLGKHHCNSHYISHIRQTSSTITAISKNPQTTAHNPASMSNHIHEFALSNSRMSTCEFTNIHHGHRDNRKTTS